MLRSVKLYKVALYIQFYLVHNNPHPHNNCAPIIWGPTEWPFSAKICQNSANNWPIFNPKLPLESWESQTPFPEVTHTLANSMSHLCRFMAFLWLMSWFVVTFEQMMRFWRNLAEFIFERSRILEFRITYIVYMRFKDAEPPEDEFCQKCIFSFCYHCSWHAHTQYTVHILVALETIFHKSLPHRFCLVRIDFDQAWCINLGI